MKRKLQNTTLTINSKTKKALSIVYKIVVPLVFIGLFFGLWQILCEYSNIPHMILPTPAETINAFIRKNALIMQHTKVTMIEAVLGLFFGVLVGFALALLMDAFRLFNYGFKPLLVISQTIPTIVIAPLFIMWLGYGIEPKVMIVALTTFFPIAIGLNDGYQSADKDMIDLMRAMGANKLQIFFYLKMPNALPNFFSSLKISATYAIVGAVISEWVGATGGLGFYIQRAQRIYAYDTMFAIIFWIISLSLLLMLGVEILKRCFIHWEKKEN